MLINYASKYRGTIDKWIDDAPARALIWKSGNANYSLSMLLEERGSPALHVWAQAWRDDEEALRRRSLKPAETFLTHPTELNLRVTFNQLLGEIRPRVGLLNLRGTREGVIIMELSPYPSRV